MRTKNLGSMSGEKSIHDIPEDARIEISNEQMIEYWTEKLQCTRFDLIYAVIQVGNSAKAVDAFLEMNRMKG